MRSLDDVYSDLEGDRQAREAEISILERLIPETDGDDRDSLKRSLVLLIYSHVEGYCKFSLLTYVQVLNAARLKCAQAAYPLVAASMSGVFAALRDPNSKHEFFRKVAPSDSFLHLVAREQVFIERIDEAVSQEVRIPDRVVDTKSNVTPELLMKMLFQLGIDHTDVLPYAGSLQKLLGVRNAIAHGDRLKVPSDATIGEFRDTAGEVMKFLQDEVFYALRDSRFLRVARAA